MIGEDDLFVNLNYGTSFRGKRSKPTDLWIMGEKYLCLNLNYGLIQYMCKSELWVDFIYVSIWIMGDKFGLLVELYLEGYARNGATPSRLLN